MAMITPAALTALNTSFTAIYQRGYQAANPWYTQIATEVPSNTRSNTYGWMAKVPLLREWIGPRVLQNISSHVYTLTNRSYELTIVVDKEDWADENLGVYTPVFEQMGSAARKTPDRLLRDMIQANGASFDGVPFFDPNHPLDPAGVQSNTFGLALTAANYDTVRSTMFGFRGEDGQPLEVMPNLMVVPPQLEMTAKRIVNADLIANAAGTAAETNVMQGSATVLVLPELANQATRWYLFDVARPIKPFVWQQREPFTLVRKDAPTDDNIFFDRELIWGVDGRGAAGFALWFLAARSTP